MVVPVMWIAPVNVPFLPESCIWPAPLDLPDTLIAFLELECLQTIMVLHCSLHLLQLIAAALPCSLYLLASDQ